MNSLRGGQLSAPLNPELHTPRLPAQLGVRMGLGRIALDPEHSPHPALTPLLSRRLLPLFPGSSSCPFPAPPTPPHFHQDKTPTSVPGLFASCCYRTRICGLIRAFTSLIDSIGQEFGSHIAVLGWGLSTSHLKA